MVICCGEALIDMVRVPISGSGEGFFPHPGGSPYNAAIAIGRLGVPVKFLGQLSKDFFGETLAKRLRDSNVGDELVTRCEQNSTLAFVKMDKGKEPQYIFYAEGTSAPSIDDLPQQLPEETNCILFGSIALTMEPIASAIESLILREGSRKSTDQMDGAPVISFDPNIRPFMIKDQNAYLARCEKWIASSTIAKFSLEDIGYIYPNLEPEKALQKMLSMGPWLAICTLGPKGALALLRRNDGSLTKIKAPSVNLPLADTIGAGDAFHGAFLAWLELKGKMSRSALASLSETELYEALFFANKAASITCSRKGAEPPTRREVDNLKTPEAKSGKSPAKKTEAAAAISKTRRNPPAPEKKTAKKK